MASARAGVTLVELLWVLTFMGIMMAMSMPRIDVARFQVDAGSQEVVSAFMAFRGQAIVKQHDVILEFHPEQNEFLVLFDANNNGELDEGEQTRLVQLSEHVAFGLGGAEAMTTMPEDISFTKTLGTRKILTFRRNGSGSEEGGVYITSMRSRGNTAYTQDTRALRIERSTGRVRCFSYRSGAWEEGC